MATLNAAKVNGFRVKVERAEANKGMGIIEEYECLGCSQKLILQSSSSKGAPAYFRHAIGAKYCSYTTSAPRKRRWHRY